MTDDDMTVLRDKLSDSSSTLWALQKFLWIIESAKYSPVTTEGITVFFFNGITLLSQDLNNNSTICNFYYIFSIGRKMFMTKEPLNTIKTTPTTQKYTKKKAMRQVIEAKQSS